MARKNTKRKFDYQLDINTGLYRIHALRDINCLGFLIKANQYGGLIDDPNLLSQNDECWLDENATAINSNINDNCFIGGHSLVIDSNFTKNVRVLGNSKIQKSVLNGDVNVRNNVQILNNCILDGKIDCRDNTIITTHANITGNNLVFKNDARVRGPIIINRDNVIIKKDINLDIESNLLLRFGMPSKKGRYRTYKLVSSTNISDVYESIYDSNFKYDLRQNKNIKISSYNKKKNNLCNEGLHVVFNEDFNWRDVITNKADKIFTCWIDPEDIISIDYNILKARVKKFYVSKVRDYPIIYNENSSIRVYHMLNTRNLITYVYNNKNNEAFYDYIVTAVSESAANINFKISKEDSIDNYNIVIIGARDMYGLPIRPPDFHKEIVKGDGLHETFTIKHNLNSMHVMPVLYDNIDLEDVNSKFRIVHLDNNNILVDPMRLLKKNETYTLLVLRPTYPTFNGVISDRGLANNTPYYFIKIVMGDEFIDNTITVTHNFNRFDVFGRIMDYETKEYFYTGDYTFRRLDDNNVRITIKKRIYHNHQYIIYLSKC